MGRFTTKDTWGGDYNWPMSLNGWLYVAGNPVNWVDPTGHIISTEICEDWGECFIMRKGSSPPAPPPPPKDPPRKPPVEDDPPGVYEPTPNPYDFGPTDDILETLANSGLPTEEVKCIFQQFCEQNTYHPMCGRGSSSGNWKKNAKPPSPVSDPWQMCNQPNAKWNPLCYNTLSIDFRGVGAAILGLDLDIQISGNMKAFRYRNMNEMDVSMTISAGVQGGISEALAAGLMVVGSEGSVSDLEGVYLIGENEDVYGDIAICVGVCVMGTVGFNDLEDLADINPNSIGWGGGVGEGIGVPVAIDISGDLAAWTGRIVYGDSSGSLDIPVLDWLKDMFGITP